MFRLKFFFHYEIPKQVNRVQFWVAWHLPKWLVYFAAVRLIADGTTGQYGNTDPSTLGSMDALKRYSDLHGVG